MRYSKDIKKAIEKGDYNWLGRDGFIDYFSDYILVEGKSNHICLDGVWGSGKTTCVLGVIEKLKEKTMDDVPIIVYFDAWKYEHYEHPVYSLLKILEEIEPDILKKIELRYKKEGYQLQVGLNIPYVGLNLGIT